MPMTTAETDRRVDEARESLVARIEELGRRLHGARERLDVKRYIVAHPLIAVGAALALGAVLGFVGGGKRKSKSADKRGLGATLGAAVGTLVMAGLKEIAVHQIRRQFEGGDRDREAEASSEPELESFFKH